LCSVYPDVETTFDTEVKVI